MSHSIVWLDNKHAKIFEFTEKTKEGHKVDRKEHHTHHHSDSAGKEDEKKFFNALSKDLSHFQEILLVGPGLGKDHFKKYLEEHHKDVLQKVIGVETVDHPTDNELVALAKRVFKAHHILI
ncbi:MAG: eRF1 domain 2 [Leptospira sp.]|jgi:stalled ribosome rescue protein Dom34|nr:eRF1 domain 2 [Leptospira sp.]